MLSWKSSNHLYFSDGMKQSLLHVCLVVRDYDEAIDYYTSKLKFTLLQDIYQPEQDKRWVTVAPPGQTQGCTIVLAQPSNEEQKKYIGNQTGGRVTFFLQTDNFWRDYEDMRQQGIEFVREPKTAEYGIVAVFKDIYGNLWDLIEPAN